MRRIIFAAIVAAGVLMVAPAWAGAQTVTNPTGVAFTASADHATVTGYTLGFFATGATNPIQEVTLGKGTPDAQQVITAAIDSKPLGFGTYTARVRAVAGAQSSPWSGDSNPFSRVPLTPGVPAVR